jgi:hypothetical protein
MSSKLKEYVGIVQNLDQFINDYFTITLELSLFASNIKKEVCGVLDFIFSFLETHEKRKTHNMYLLMLDPQFTNLHLVSLFVGREQNIYIVKKYDWKSLQPMLLKCYHHLHLVENYDVESTHHKSYEDNNLDILEMIASTIKPVLQLVTKEQLIFKRFKMDSKEIKCP